MGYKQSCHIFPKEEDQDSCGHGIDGTHPGSASESLAYTVNPACSYVLGTIGRHGGPKGHISLGNHLLDLAGSRESGNSYRSQHIQGRLDHNGSDCRYGELESHRKSNLHLPLCKIPVHLPVFFSKMQFRNLPYNVEQAQKPGYALGYDGRICRSGCAHPELDNEQKVQHDV